MVRYVLIALCTLRVASYAQVSIPASVQSFRLPLDTTKLPRFPIDTLQSKKDSLIAATVDQKGNLNEIKGRLDSLRFTLQSKLDSITRLPRPDSVQKKMLSGISARSDSLANVLSNLQKQVHSPEELTRVQSDLTRQVSGIQTMINDKLPMLQQGAPAIPSSIQLPSMDVLNDKLPDLSALGDNATLNTSIEKIQLSSDRFSLPNLDIPSVEQQTVPTIDGNLGEVGARSGEVVNAVIPDQQLIVGKLDEIPIEPELLEDKITSMDEVKDIEKEIELADQMKRYYDPEVAKEEALNKAKQEAINHFAGHEEELKIAMQKLSELKNKFHDTEAALDLFAKRQRPLKGKPLIERFIPGITFQYQQYQSFWLDITPQVAFMISRKFTSGLGWSERLAYNFNEMNWDVANRVFGIRSFTNLKLKDGFYLRGETELMNAPLRDNKLNSEIYDRSWVWSFMAGAKRDFPISKKIRGNVQMLYNLYNPDKRSPYVQRFMLRLGLELSLKKKQKIVNRS